MGGLFFFVSESQLSIREFGSLWHMVINLLYLFVELASETFFLPRRKTNLFPEYTWSFLLQRSEVPVGALLVLSIHTQKLYVRSTEMLHNGDAIWGGWL